MAQSGLIIIADFEAIQGETSRRFTSIAKRHTPIVGERYLEVMENEEPTRDVLNDLKGRSIEDKVEEVKLISGGELRTGRGQIICNSRTFGKRL